MKIFILLIFFISLVNISNATIRRVGYIATIQPVAGFDYNNFQGAHDASATGDTIQLYPSTTGSFTYTGTISKTLVILGPGFFTNSFTLASGEYANSNLQNMAGSIYSCTFNIDLGSTGTVIEGINGLTLNTVDRVDALNNISIYRCRNVSLSFVNSGVCNNWTVGQCYGVTIVQSGPSNGFTGNRTINNLNITNSVIFSNINLSTSPTGTYTGNTIYNSNFLGGSSIYLNAALFTIQNCIFEVQTFSGVSNVTFKNNLTTQSATGNPISTNPGGSGNVFNVNLSSVYVGYPTNSNYSPDARFQLIPGGGNPANNGGLVPNTATVTNCGIYGSTLPYKLSGIPPIPVYYQLGAPSAVTTGSNYTVTFSVRSNN